MKGIFIFDKQRSVTVNYGNPMAKKKEEWVNPRIIDFSLSRPKIACHIKYYSGCKLIENLM